jgi:hypothetical protein
MSIADQASAIIHESDPSFNHFDYIVAGCSAYLAVQHGMGLLSERRIGLDRHHTRHSSLDASVKSRLRISERRTFTVFLGESRKIRVGPSGLPA